MLGYWSQKLFNITLINKDENWIKNQVSENDHSLLFTAFDKKILLKYQIKFIF